MIQSGRSRQWLRGRFPGWLADGHARARGHERLYRAIIVPRRAQASAAYEAGKRAALEARGNAA